MRSDGATDGLAASAPEGGPKAGGRREIILRVVSAAVLAPLGVWAVWAGGLALAGNGGVRRGGGVRVDAHGLAGG